MNDPSRVARGVVCGMQDPHNGVVAGWGGGRNASGHGEDDGGASAEEGKASKCEVHLDSSSERTRRSDFHSRRSATRIDNENHCHWLRTEEESFCTTVAGGIDVPETGAQAATPLSERLQPVWPGGLPGQTRTSPRPRACRWRSCSHCMRSSHTSHCRSHTRRCCGCTSGNCSWSSHTSRTSRCSSRTGSDCTRRSARRARGAGALRARSPRGPRG